ncbi:hypothetical protein [Roseibacillus persicicus]|uniref:hypothetical protein n=1 Tax=Roseibacillus persicicus TaxID=454148 RepID=UPI00167703ED|nr:hypothetical protein [Roseibacillus persicicus]MDQ8190044.1 hypothetical protein [Roseibacillus persicicus]
MIFPRHSSGVISFAELLSIVIGIPALILGMLIGIPSYQVIESTPNLEEAITIIFDDHSIRGVFLWWMVFSVLVFAVRTERWKVDRFKLRLVWFCASLLGMVGGAAAFGLFAR